MTKRGNQSQIDVRQTVSQALRAAQQALAERIARELRYSPGFHGEITVTIMFKGGVPQTYRESAQQTNLIEPQKT